MLKLSSPILSEEAINAVADILRTGILVQGEWVGKFEASLAEYLGTGHVVAVSSGTAALHLALLAAGVQPGDEVIVPAFTFPATANSVIAAGGRPVLVDVCAHDLCLDVERIESALTPRTRAIMPVHEFGQSADMAGIAAIALRHGLTVVEDAACALGTRFGDRSAGTIGDCGCFSFHPRKAITTGEGGAISTDNTELANTVRELRNHGIRASTSGIDFVSAGFNYRLTEFQAAMGYYQLRGFDLLVDQRIQQARRYNEKLADIPGLSTPAAMPDRRAVYQTYHVVLPDRVDRQKVVAGLRRQGIESNLGAQALNCLTFFREAYGYLPESCPVATKLFRKGLALPIGPHCSVSDIDNVASVLRSILQACQEMPD